MTTFWAFLFRANEINTLANVKSSNVVFFAKNVVISGVFPTTRVVIPKSGESAPGGPTDTRSAGTIEDGVRGSSG